MNQELGLRILGQIMDWTDDQAREEFRWLRLMARLKYDGYRDFQAGMRFFESLATWLQQFKQDDRTTAYSFVRSLLVYVGPGEMQHLVEQFFPRVVHERLLGTVAESLDIPDYLVLANLDALAAVDRLRRQTLFLGLSDGARIDIVRHANVGLLTNEQLVVATQLDKDKWTDLLDNLRTDLNDPLAQFRLVYLIDDFAGTGTSLLRFNAGKDKWSGKLMRFKESLEAAATQLQDSIVAPDWELCIHHYIATTRAAAAIRKQVADPSPAVAGWAKDVHVSFGTVLPSDLPLNAVARRHEAFRALTRAYYDPALRTRHTDVGGAKHLGLGYGGCALPLVLDHNTPNNAVALLWAETSGGSLNGTAAPEMRPLFRRRQRHA